MSAMSAFIIFRGLKNELLCTVNNDQQLGSSQNFASCKSFSDYTANEIQSMERLGVPTWLEYSYYPDLFFYWLTFWACYLLAEQVRIFECLMNVNKERFKILVSQTANLHMYSITQTVWNTENVPKWTSNIQLLCSTASTYPIIYSW